MTNEVSKLFESTFGAPPAQMTFAPGRIEFIGNHTDYNGGLVMGAAVTEGITVAARRIAGDMLRLVSDSGALVEVPLHDRKPQKGPTSWTNYPVGVAEVMADEGMALESGFEIAVASNLPAGAGMSSSAALELATARVLAALYGFEADKAEFARIGRRAENEFVGMPCGILDQGVSSFGEPDHLVKIDCASESYSTIAMPEGTHFWIFNSNVKHSLVESAYADRHKECHDALDILRHGRPDAPNLSAFTEADVRAAESDLGDLLFRRALHVVGENARVREVEADLSANDLGAVGRALFASHESSRVNFENSIEELDILVELLREQSGVFGARLTGGGFGGAAMAFTDSSFGKAEAEAVASKYAERAGRDATIIHTRAGQGARLL